MKTNCLILLLLLSSISFTESFEYRNSCIPFKAYNYLWFSTTRPPIEICTVTPMNKLVLCGTGDKEFWFDFNYGLLSVGGNMKMTDGAKLFVKYLVKEYLMEWIAMRDTIRILRNQLKGCKYE